MPFLRRPHCALYYEVHGDLQSPRPPLVFAHGLGGNHLSWWQQLAHFGPHHACVVFSHRGFASSPEAPGGPGLAGFADDLLALLDHLELRAPVLIAQSMGGWTCTLHAAAHPDRLRALVLACTTGAIAHPELEAIHATHHARVQPPLPAHVSPAAGLRLAREQPAMNLLYNQLAALSPWLDRAAIMRTLAAMRTQPLATLRVPLLCLAAAEDLLISADAVAWLAGHVPGARLHHEPDAGHSLYWERPATFNRVLAEFLATLAPTR